MPTIHIENIWDKWKFYLFQNTYFTTYSLIPIPKVEIKNRM